MKCPNRRGQQLEFPLRPHGRPRQRPEDFKADINRLVDTLNLLGKTDAKLSVTRAQAQLIRGFTAYPTDPLTYRQHPVRIVTETEKL